jgi:SNF2 family DNA or RNA helicase
MRFGLKRASAGFFLAPGLGKTSIILFIFKILKTLGLVDTLLVLAKKTICYEVWPAEARKWKGLEKLKVSVVHGDRDAALRKRVSIYAMNYEGLDWLTQKEQRWFFEDRKIMLAVDESSKLRNHGTQRFKALKKILHRFERRYILTGSPAPRSLMNLFGQVYVLDFGKALGRYITKFKLKYFEPTGFMGKDWTLQEDGEKRIYKQIKHLILRYGHDQLDLPPLTFIKRKVTLPPKAREQYDKMEEEFVMLFKDGAVVAANAAVASGKCRQIANGAVFYDDFGDIADEKKPFTRKWKAVHDAKLDNLVELLEELNGEPALVAYEFRHDKERIKQYMKKHAPQFANAPFIDGATKPHELSKYKKRWDKGLEPVMFAHPATAGYGLNLQGKGGIVVYFAMTWNLEDFEQFYQRVWRQGQKRRVLVYLIMAKNTVDELMYKSIKIKDAGQQRLLKAMERHRWVSLNRRRVKSSKKSSAERASERRPRRRLSKAARRKLRASIRGAPRILS